ncbi:DUF4936 family protein [Nitrogeniibacter mangrovi]|uniref:DUF4936 family protein n=1 Tax=Nitrogeniibacter mangrovi TaxID=2016596 RepID=A0A6C1B3J0_9RHOO|nr:DUF4936 family protein [Nitrogeniibacter mangrovi]QID17953.1 DUF4936 family protein [Nitrogeniibacter mangrovi]
MIDIYIYYKVDAAHRELALAAAHTVLERMTVDAERTETLSQRADDPLTWLEIYRGVASESEFLARMDRVLADSGLLHCLAGERHIERFVPCA